MRGMSIISQTTTFCVGHVGYSRSGAKSELVVEASEPNVVLLLPSRRRICSPITTCEMWTDYSYPALRALYLSAARAHQ